MNKKYFFAFIIVMTLMTYPFTVSAEEVLTFHFEVNNGKLQFDTSAPNHITFENDPNFSIVDFSKREVFGDYRMELFDTSGAKSLDVIIPTRNGKFIYEIPKFTIINKYKIYSKESNVLILEGSLEEFVLCNNNTICEFEKGETINTCLPDCASGNVKYSPSTQQKIDASNGLLKDPKTGDILLNNVKIETPQEVIQTENIPEKDTSIVPYFVMAIAIFCIMGAGVYFIRKRR